MNEDTSLLDVEDIIPSVKWEELFIDINVAKEKLTDLVDIFTRVANRPNHFRQHIYTPTSAYWYWLGKVDVLTDIIQYLANLSIE